MFGFLNRWKKKPTAPVQQQLPKGYQKADNFKYDAQGNYNIITSVLQQVIVDTVRMQKKDGRHRQLLFVIKSTGNNGKLQTTTTTKRKVVNEGNYNKLSIAPDQLIPLVNEFIEYVESIGFFCTADPKEIIVKGLLDFSKEVTFFSKRPSYEGSFAVALTFPEHGSKKGFIRVSSAHLENTTELASSATRLDLVYQVKPFKEANEPQHKGGDEPEAEMK